jgi:hypothetical protein
MGTPMTYISGNTGAYQSGTFNKGTIALNLNPSSLASGNNWYNGVDVTATQYLIYSDTYSTGIATQANSKPTAWTTPDLSDTSLLNLINTLPDRIGVLPFTSLPLALQWLNATNEYFLIKTNFENIVTSGLVLNLDAGWYNSYSGTTTWFDIKGGYNGTLTNGPTFNGGSQGAIVFDGSDDYVVGPNIGSLSTFTVDCWFYPTSNPGNSSAIITDIYTSYLNYVIGWGNSEVGSNTFFGGFYNNGWVKTSGITATLNQWWNLTLTFSNGELKFYSFGNLYSTTSTVNTPQGGGSGYRVGRRWDLPDYFIGKIPNVKIYNRALSPQEILQNYNAQKLRFGIYDIVQSGNTVNLDASNYLSYPRSGTTWSDMTSTGFLGTFTNGPIWSSDSGGTITFDGTDDYIQGNLSFSAMSNNFSISTWVYPNTTQNQYAEIFGNHVDGYKGFVFQQNGSSTNNYYFGYGDNTQWNLTPTFYLAPSIWHNIVAIKNSSGTLVYDNGKLISSLSQTTNVAPTTTTLKIGVGYGSGLSSGMRYWNGKVSNFQIYNRVLSQQEIVQNYESYRKIIGSSGYTTNGLVLNLDAGNYASYPTTGTKWVDISGSYNNGTITNGPVWSNINGGIITLDGIDDYVNIGNRTNLQMGTGDFTMCLWVKMNNPPNTYGSPYINVLFNCKDAAAATAGYGITFFYGGGNQNKLLWSTGNGSSAVEILTQNTFPELLGAWGHIVMVRQNGSTNNGCFYVNGVLQPLSSSATVLNVNTTTNMTIGNTSDRYGPYYTKGDFAIAQIYNRALTANEVLQNYNASKGRFGL